MGKEARHAGILATSEGAHEMRKSLGQRLYEAMAEHYGWVWPANNRRIDAWDDYPEAIKEEWRIAARVAKKLFGPKEKKR